MTTNYYPSCWRASQSHFSCFTITDWWYDFTTATNIDGFSFSTLFLFLHQPVKVSQGSTYSELLSVIEEMSREIRPTYAGSKSAMERLKRGIWCCQLCQCGWVSWRVDQCPQLQFDCVFNLHYERRSDTRMSCNRFGRIALSFCIRGSWINSIHFQPCVSGAWLFFFAKWLNLATTGILLSSLKKELCSILNYRNCGTL